MLKYSIADMLSIQTCIYQVVLKGLMVFVSRIPLVVTVRSRHIQNHCKLNGSEW